MLALITTFLVLLAMRGSRKRAGHAKPGEIAAGELFASVEYLSRVHVEGRQ